MIDKLLPDGLLAESFSMLQAEETYSKLADFLSDDLIIYVKLSPVF